MCTRDELEVLNRGSKKSDQLMKKLMGDDKRKEQQSTAEKRKNTLLEYDRASEKRTQVRILLSNYFTCFSLFS